MLKGFISYLIEQVQNKSIYVLGAQGQNIGDITEAWIKKREHNKKSNYSRAIAMWKARKDKYKKAKVFDCSGLGMYWLQNQMKVYSYDMSANSMYGKCEKIKRSELKIGDWVFRGSSLRKSHIGYVVDIVDGVPIIVEAKGRDDGVVKRSINASGSDYWKYCGRPKYFKAEIEAQASSGGGSPSKPVFTRLLKCEKKDGKYLYRGEDVKALQKMLIAQGYSCGKSGADGIYGKDTEDAVISFQIAKKIKIDGIVGKQTVTAIGGIWRP